jgi:hypothetical protein
MWTSIRTTLSQWYIAGIGIFLIAGGLFLASHWSSSPAPVAAAQDHQSPALEMAARATPPALPAMPKAIATAAPSTPSIQQPSARRKIAWVRSRPSFLRPQYIRWKAVALCSALAWETASSGE